MDENKLMDFIHFMVQNNKLSYSQKLLRDRLFVKDLLNIKIESSPKKKKEVLSPVKTAEFLGLFDKGDGLKYLTHCFDVDSNVQTIKEVVSQVVELTNKYRNEIPSSLYACIMAYTKGNKDKGWFDYNNELQKFNLSDDKVIAKCKESNKHPKEIEEFQNAVNLFRHTLRVTDGLLYQFLEKQKIVHSNDLNIEFNRKILNADFYTNNRVFFHVIERLFNIMKDAPSYKEVSVEFKRIAENKRQIVITQKDSYSPNTVDDAVRRLQDYAGDLGGIRNKLSGYCDWEIISMWDGEPFRLAVLSDSDQITKTSVSKDDVKGFSHLFTFYI